MPFSATERSKRQKIMKAIEDITSIVIIAH